MAPANATMPPQPSPEHKEGVRFHVFSDDIDGLRVFSSNAICVCRAVDKLDDEAKEAARGLLPRVKRTGADKTVTKGGAIYAPVLTIVGWEPRSEAVFGPMFGPVPAPGAVTAPVVAPAPVAETPAQALAEALRAGQAESRPGAAPAISWTSSARRTMRPRPATQNGAWFKSGWLARKFTWVGRVRMLEEPSAVESMQTCGGLFLLV